MLREYTWDMTGYKPKSVPDMPNGSITRHMAEHIFQLEPEPPAMDSQNEYPVCLAEKEFDIFLILPTPLQAAAEQVHQRPSRCGWRRSVRHRPIYRYKTLLPGANAPKADGL